MIALIVIASVITGVELIYFLVWLVGDLEDYSWFWLLAVSERFNELLADQEEARVQKEQDAELRKKAGTMRIVKSGEKYTAERLGPRSIDGFKWFLLLIHENKKFCVWDYDYSIYARPEYGVARFDTVEEAQKVATETVSKGKDGGQVMGEFKA